MIFGLDTENDLDGFLTCVATSCRTQKAVWTRPFPADMLPSLHRIWLLEAKLKTVHIWSINLQYDLVNLYGSRLPDFLALQLGRGRIVGAKYRGERIIFRDVARFIVRKTAEEIGAALRYPKLRVKLDDLKDGTLPPEKLAAYCMRDCEIARKAGEAIESQLAKTGVGL